MRKKTEGKALLLLVVCLLLASPLFAVEKAPKRVVDFAHSTLVKYGTNSTIVKAVRAENAKGKTLDWIKEHDDEWKNTAGIVNYMRALMNNKCGKYLRSLQRKYPYFAEIFVMDNQGANVAMTDKTSDYWQGDEAKFIESYKGGKGGVHIGDVEFDDSAQAYLVQVSVPVKDGKKIIGAITFGIDIDMLD